VSKHWRGLWNDNWQVAIRWM